MRSIAFATLLLVGVAACPAFASGNSIRAKYSTWGCQFSATLRLFPKLTSASQEDFDRILDSGHCLVIDAHQRLTVVRKLPSAYLAIRDMRKDEEWAVFVRKSDFTMLRHGTRNMSAHNRHHETALHAALRREDPRPSCRKGIAAAARRPIEPSRSIRPRVECEVKLARTVPTQAPRRHAEHEVHGGTSLSVRPALGQGSRTGEWWTEAFHTAVRPRLEAGDAV
jgi:hypothetical protein